MRSLTLFNRKVRGHTLQVLLWLPWPPSTWPDYCRLQRGAWPTLPILTPIYRYWFVGPLEVRRFLL